MSIRLFLKNQKATTVSGYATTKHIDQVGAELMAEAKEAVKAAEKAPEPPKKVTPVKAPEPKVLAAPVEPLKPASEAPNMLEAEPEPTKPDEEPASESKEPEAEPDTDKAEK